MNATRLVDGDPLTAAELCDELFALLTGAGDTKYDEAVTQLEHALQAASLAEEAHDDEAVHVAALLHDVGHLLLDEHDRHGAFLEQDLRHETVGARVLARWFGPEVSGPVALHVKAKRYLVATDPAYASTLSAASTRSLQLQGGAMAPRETEAFLRLPHAQVAVALRRWDDGAKDPHAQVPVLEHWRDAICRTALVGRPR